MIVRTWQGHTTQENAAAYVDHLRSAVIPELRSIINTLVDGR